MAKNNNQSRKGNQRGKGRKPYNNSRGNKNQRRNEEIIDTAEAEISKPNDVSWYSRNAHLLEEATRLPFAYPLGQTYDVPGASHDVTAQPSMPLDVPGICTLYFVPTIGPANNIADPVNTAARAIYTYIRNMNSGSKNYDQADLMMYLLAMDSLYMFHSFIRKVVGVTKLYTPVNRFYPRAVLESMGIDPDDAFENVSDWLYFCNQIAYQIGMTTAPASMPFYDRHKWMSSGMYMDQNVQKAQIYHFVPTHLWQFTNLGPTGTNLKPIKLTSPGEGLKLSDMRTIYDTLMQNIIGDEDFAVMSGDILKAFGFDGVVKLDNTDDAYAVYPAYDPDVLMQIHNSTAFGPIVVGTSEIKQDPSINNGAVISTITFDRAPTQGLTNTSSTRHVAYDRVLNLMTDDATPKAIIEATRLSGCSTNWALDKGTFTATTSGTEIVEYYGVTRADFTADTDEYNFDVFTNTINFILEGGPGMTPNPREALRIMKVASAFDYFPQLFMEGDVLPAGAARIDGPVADLTNFTIVSNNTLARMHEVAALSEFDVPQMGFSKG